MLLFISSLFSISSSVFKYLLLFFAFIFIFLFLFSSSISFSKRINLLDNSSHNKIENFSFKGNYSIVNSNSNKNKISDIDISNSKSEKTNSYNDKDRQKFSISFHNNFFSFENSVNKINNKESLQSLLLKEKIKNLFNKYFVFHYKLKVKEIINKFRTIKFIILIKKYIINKVNKAIINSFK